MIGIEKEEQLLYGVDKNIDKRYLYVRHIELSNYQEPENIKECMALLGSKWSFYQYNSNGKKSNECDYFFWQYVDDSGHKNWQSVDITIGRTGADFDYKMRRLIDYIEHNICGVNLKISIKYDDIRNLINAIDDDVNFENALKK